MQNPMRLGKSQDVAVGTTSVTCATAFGLTTIVRVLFVAAAVGNKAYITFGSAPVATIPGGAQLASNFPEYFLVRPGEKVAVIGSVASAGTLTVTEMTR